MSRRHVDDFGPEQGEVIPKHRSSRRYADDFGPEQDEVVSKHRSSRRHADDLGPEPDEVIPKHRSSRRGSHRERDDFVRRQLRDVEKTQREASRPGSSSSSSQEIHIHYHSNGFSAYHEPQLIPAGAASDGHAVHNPKIHGVSATELTKELKGLTMSWITKRDPSLTRKRSTHRSRNGHEKRAKHGKKRDVFLAPLEQRWVCYECGKVRSDKIQERHPLAGGQKMQPNWCGQCRISNELAGTPLDWHGQRHYCWGCGIVRSEKYHRENPIPEGDDSEPNYCKPCREASPGFDRNLREASEVGSEVSVRDKVSLSRHDPPL